MDEAHWQAVLADEGDLWSCDPSELTPAGCLDLLAMVRSEQAHLAAREAALLVAIAGAERRVRQVAIDDPEGDSRSFDLIDERVDLIAAATRRSVGSVRRRVHLARTIMGRLPRTRARLDAGVISPEHADVIARTADGLPDEMLRAYETRVLARASRLTPSEVGVLARRVRARLDRAGEQARRQESRRHIDVRIWGEDDGLACLQARLPIADAARVHAALDARSRAVEADCDASMGQRRAQALVESICGPVGPVDGRDGGVGSAGVGVEVQVTVDLATLAALGNASAVEQLGAMTVRLGSTPAEPVPAQALRDLLGDPALPITFRRLITDPVSGDLLDRGRRAYRAPDALRAFLIARDGTCQFPGCLRAGELCDIDHVRPWARGGQTSRCNLICLCRRHHVLKTHGDWDVVERRADGSVVWRGPDGREYVSHPFAPHRHLTGAAAESQRPAPPDHQVDPPPDPEVDPPPF